MAKKLADPKDSSAQRLDRGNTTDSAGSTKRYLTGGSQIGGGTMRSYMQDHLARMYEDIAQTTKKLELEQRRLYKLNKDLVTADSEYSQKKGIAKTKKTGDPAQDVIRERAEAMRKKHVQDGRTKNGALEVRQVERRLEKAISDLNQSTAENEQLMKQIDQLRKERQVLDTVFQQMTRSIAKKRGEVDKLRGAINEQQQMGEDAKQKQGALNKMLERERTDFKKTTSDFKTKVHEENRVLQQQAITYNPAGQRAKAGQGAPYMIADEEEHFSEQSMHRRILKLSFLNTIQRRHIKQHQKNIEVYEQAFATIKSSTGISDIEEIVKIFAALEQRNFSLLTYVNQLNGEIEAIDIRKRELENALKSHQQAEGNSKDRKAAALKEIRESIDKTKQAVAEKDKMIEEASKALDDCRPLIWNAVKFLKKELPRLVKVGYEGEAPAMKAQAPDEHDEQLNHHLVYIEEAILQFRAALSEGAVSRARPMPTTKASPSPGQKDHIYPPSAHITGDDSDDDPDLGQPGLGDKPLDLKELKERALAQIQRRKKRPGPQGRQAHAQDQGADEDDLDVGQRTQPPKAHAVASPVTSKDSGAEALPAGPVAISKSPSVGKPAEPAKEQGGEAGYRGDMWWREQNKR